MNLPIRQRALELGFEACHFTRADPPSSAAHFQQWLAAGRHGVMDYLQRNARKRVDPQQVLPDARNIICVAASYQNFRWDSSAVSAQPSVVEPGVEPRLPPATGHPPATGIVARYARYDDYHDVLQERLDGVLGIRQRTGVQRIQRSQPQSPCSGAFPGREHELLSIW